MKTLVKKILLATLLTFTAQANAGIIYYDWVSDSTNTRRASEIGGEGFLVFDTTGVSDDPANFIGAPLIDLFFQFVPNGPTYTLSDFPTRTRLFNADDGVITNVNFNLFLDNFVDTSFGQGLSSSIDFTRTGANCLTIGQPDPTGTFLVQSDECDGIADGEDYNFVGEWVLRQTATSVPTPQTFGLVVLGLLFITLKKRKQHLAQ